MRSNESITSDIELIVINNRFVYINFINNIQTKMENSEIMNFRIDDRIKCVR